MKSTLPRSIACAQSHIGGVQCNDGKGQAGWTGRGNGEMESWRCGSKGRGEDLKRGIAHVQLINIPPEIVGGQGKERSPLLQNDLQAIRERE